MVNKLSIVEVLTKNRWLLLAVFCVVSRLLTAIFYVEDPDSLRFALAALDFDLARSQPHFPGYPVFCFLMQVFTLMLGKFSLAFSFIGGVATFLIIYYSIKITEIYAPHINKWILSLLLFLNPMIWLMGNRYMPDLLGAATVMAIFYCYARANENKRSKYPFLLQFCTGILAGLRLSYLPLVVIPSLVVFFRGEKKIQQILALGVGAMVWLGPVVALTDLDTLLSIAQLQAEGHFVEWGGTITSEPSYLERAAVVIESIWAYGLGGWLLDRHWITLPLSAGLLVGLVVSIVRMKAGEVKIARLFGIAILLYLIWIYLFQNIMYKPRHVLPLIPFIIFAVASGYSALWRKTKTVFYVSFSVLLISTSAITAVLVKQHKNPSAIAQAKDLFEALPENSLTIVSIPLVNDYLRRQGVKSRFLSIEQDQAIIENLEDNFYTIGVFPKLIKQQESKQHVFYHNPYVNKMWPTVIVNVY